MTPEWGGIIIIFSKEKIDETQTEQRNKFTKYTTEINNCNFCNKQLNRNEGRQLISKNVNHWLKIKRFQIRQQNTVTVFGSNE